ncbi:MAG: hypothetical protein PVI03_06685 [Candidatus Thorarchaeota archaeon]|jgi:macrodomain Ter protein organizer (MatP/YcbG family)
MRVKRSITIDKDVWERVAKEAKEQHISISRHVEKIIRDMFQYEWELKKIQEKSHEQKGLH